MPISLCGFNLIGNSNDETMTGDLQEMLEGERELLFAQMLQQVKSCHCVKCTQVAKRLIENILTFDTDVSSAVYACQVDCKLERILTEIASNNACIGHPYRCQHREEPKTAPNIEQVMTHTEFKNATINGSKQRNVGVGRRERHWM